MFSSKPTQWVSEACPDLWKGKTFYGHFYSSLFSISYRDKDQNQLIEEDKSNLKENCTDTEYGTICDDEKDREG